MFYDEFSLNCIRNPNETERAVQQLQLQYIDAAGNFPIRRNSSASIHGAQTFPMMLVFQRFHEFGLGYKDPAYNPGEMLLLASSVFGLCEDDEGAEGNGMDWSGWKFGFTSRWKHRPTFSSLMNKLVEMRKNDVSRIVAQQVLKKQCASRPLYCFEGFLMR